MKRKNLTKSLLLGGVLLSSFGFVQKTFAHGYVETPPARGYQGQLARGTLGWSEALRLYGIVITNPQSLEAPKGFPEKGPADGRIASANGGFGQIGDFVLDDQTSDRWKKTAITTGDNTFTWRYTASHKTTKWHYYMTKPGWNQNAPLSREELELIGTVDHDGSLSSNNLSHTINIPENRLGYNVILAVWDVADTSNAFYNVLDVDVKRAGVPVMPTKPTNVSSTNVNQNLVSLTWDAQTTAERYNIYRNGIKITTVNGNQYEDHNLKVSTEYKYEVEAVSASNQTSEKSNAVTVKTLAEDVQEKPAAPNSLHSMGETATTISLMWNQSTHSSGIKTYKIYRGGEFIAETSGTSYKDTGLNPSTEYKYEVEAVSASNQTSEKSDAITVETLKKEEVIPPNISYRKFKVGSLSNPERYYKDEVVSYKGKRYISLVTHNNYGDGSWNPRTASSLFKRK